MIALPWETVRLLLAVAVIALVLRFGLLSSLLRWVSSLVRRG